MSDTKSPAMSSAAVGMKRSVVWIGDEAQKHVFQVMKVVTNRLRHHVGRNALESMRQEAWKKIQADWIAAAKAKAAATAASSSASGAGTAAAPPSALTPPPSLKDSKETKDTMRKAQQDYFDRMGVIKDQWAAASLQEIRTMRTLFPDPFTAALQHAVAKPPTHGSCGEMSMLVYQRIIKLAMELRYELAVANVEIEGGNHQFCIVGTNRRFFEACSGSPAPWTVSVNQLPWGPEVYVCDPWVDDGALGTFNVNDDAPNLSVTKWRWFLTKIREQAGGTGAGGEVFGATLAAQLADRGSGGRIKLIVHQAMTLAFDRTSPPPPDITPPPKPAVRKL